MSSTATFCYQLAKIGRPNRSAYTCWLRWHPSFAATFDGLRDDDLRPDDACSVCVAPFIDARRPVFDKSLNVAGAISLNRTPRSLRSAEIFATVIATPTS